MLVRICGKDLAIGLSRVSIKLERLLVGELMEETIGLTEIGSLWSFFRK